MHAPQKKHFFSLHTPVHGEAEAQRSCYPISFNPVLQAPGPCSYFLIAQAKEEVPSVTLMIPDNRPELQQ